MFSAQGLPYLHEIFIHFLIFTGLLFCEFIQFPLKTM